MNKISIRTKQLYTLNQTESFKLFFYKNKTNFLPLFQDLFKKEIKKCKKIKAIFVNNYELFILDNKLFINNKLINKSPDIIIQEINKILSWGEIEVEHKGYYPKIKVNNYEVYNIKNTTYSHSKKYFIFIKNKNKFQLNDYGFRRSICFFENSLKEKLILHSYAPIYKIENKHILVFDNKIFIENKISLTLKEANLVLAFLLSELDYDIPAYYKSELKKIGY